MKKSFIHIALCVVLLVGTRIGIAQERYQEVVGVVWDSVARTPLETATIIIKTKEKFSAISRSDSKGVFRFSKLQPGLYTMEISFVNYETRKLDLLISDSVIVNSLDTIFLRYQSKILKGVSIISEKSLVEDLGDRLIYNAEKDITNASGNAADVLRKVPTIAVDLNGNVQMRGSTNIKVLINGKPSAIMAKNPADALRQMSGETIKAVEVITSPGAKYDAEGAAGIINIITKKGRHGVNGSLTGVIGNLNRALGASINSRKKKLSLSIAGTIYQTRSVSESSNIRTSFKDGEVASILYQDSKSDNTGTSFWGQASVDFNPDSTNYFNFSATAWGGNQPNNNEMINRFVNVKNNENDFSRNERSFKNPYSSGQVDFGYIKTLKRKGSEFSFLGQLNVTPDNYLYTLNTFSSVQEPVYRERSTNKSRNGEYTFQSDYVLPFIKNGRRDTTSFNLEIGVKAIFRDIKSDAKADISPDGLQDFIPDLSRSIYFTYTQHVYSSYVSLKFITKHNLSLRTGLRMEYTGIKGEFPVVSTKFNNSYSNLIPNIFLSKKIKSQSFKLSYSQRIVRPLIWYLNPWINQSDPKNLSTGNPNLKAELNHNMEMSHGVNIGGIGIYSSIYWRFANNAIEYVSNVDTSGITMTIPENIARRENYGLNIYFSGRINQNWNINTGGDFGYAKLSSPLLHQSAKAAVWNTNLNSTYTLPKDFIIQGYCGINSGGITLQKKTSNFYWYGISAKHTFLDKKASLTISFHNPFTRGVDQNTIQTGSNFLSNGNFLSINRSITLNFEWRFGKSENSNKQTIKKIENDDKDRR